MRGVVALVVVLLAGRARADGPELQRMRFLERGENLTVTTRINKLFDTGAYDALKSGFPSTVVVQTWVYPKRSSSPVAWTRERRSAVYDLWDDVYVVRLCDRCAPVRVRHQSEAFKLLTELTDLPVAAVADLPYEEIHYLAMRVDLNPVSPETWTEVQRWLSQGSGGGMDRGGAYFGSFVSVFVDQKLAGADRVLRLRSQPFFRPSP